MSRMSQKRPVGAGFCVHLTCPYHSLSTSFPSGTTRYLGSFPTCHDPVLELAISQKIFGSFQWQINQHLDVKCVHCYCCVSAFRPLQWTDLDKHTHTDSYTHTDMCTHTDTSIFMSVMSWFCNLSERGNVRQEHLENE